MPPERDSGRPEFPNSIRAGGPFWRPKTPQAVGRSVAQTRVRTACGVCWPPKVPMSAKTLKKSSKMDRFRFAPREAGPPGRPQVPPGGSQRNQPRLRKPQTGGPRGLRYHALPLGEVFFCVFCVSKNAIFRVPHARRTPKCRPSAIRGAPNSRIVSAPRAPFGTPKNVQQGRTSVSKSFPQRQGAISAEKHPKNTKNHHVSYLR